MNILITGVHGFVGSNLVDSFSRNYKIIGLDIISPESDKIAVNCNWKDIEGGKIPDADTIIHLAGKAHDTKNQSDAQSYFEINTELTHKIYDYFIKSNAKKFIFFSSVKAAADSVNGDILTEVIIPKPIGPYGESKILAEKYIQDNWPDASSGKTVYILRPCMIHGPGNKGNLNLLYNVVKKGLPWPLGAYENRRSFTSIENLCFSIKGLLEGNIESGIYNIADDEALSTNEIIDLMCFSLGRKTYIWKMPQSMIKLIATIGGIFHLPLNPERLRKLTENYVVSNAKLKRAFGVKNMPVTAKEGLKQTISSFKQ